MNIHITRDMATANATCTGHQSIQRGSVQASLLGPALLTILRLQADYSDYEDLKPEFSKAPRPQIGTSRVSPPPKHSHYDVWCLYFDVHVPTVHAQATPAFGICASKLFETAEEG